MFKKIIAFFSKGSKIARILQYVYNGLFIATKALSSAIAALQEVEPDKNVKVIETLKTVLSYADTSMQALQKIIEWIGGESKLAPTAIASEEAREGNEVICHEARLSDITCSLREEIVPK